MGYGYKPKFGLSGGEAESELFGDTDKEIQIDFSTWLKNNRELYQPLKQAIETVKKHQSGDPHDPDPKFASDLYERTVAQMLRRSKIEPTPDNYLAMVDRVAFYSAVDTPLDYAHGIDAFLELTTDDGQSIIIGLDASTHRKDSFKTDVLVEYPQSGLDPKEDKKDWDDLVTMTAASIIEQYDLKIKEHGQRR